MYLVSSWPQGDQILPKFPAPHKRSRRPAINKYASKLRSTCPDFTEIPVIHLIRYQISLSTVAIFRRVNASMNDHVTPLKNGVKI